MDLSRYRKMTTLVLRINARLSDRPAAVISNSGRAMELHRKMGYRPRRAEVIPNGFDLSRYKPDPSAREEVRAELRIPAAAPVIGMVARVDPQKGHETFFAAAGMLAERFEGLNFILAGQDASQANPRMASMVAGAGLDPRRAHLLGRREDVPRLMNAMDVLACPSPYGEGFPSVVGEAMACGVPCAVTDVGDSAFVVGDAGRVVPPRDPKALAAALAEIVSMPPEARAELGRAARDRVEKRFSLPAVAAMYEALYESLA
jgi:glycosyltransferase involved in cell wall biosynthesis